MVPFGCGVLILLNEDERGKFQCRCALMIFVHYANQHPLYTYAVYSPRSKRILFRQDCIFLTNLFPMRSVRSREGLAVDGDVIIPYRSPMSVRDGGEAELSFGDWDERHAIPEYQDHVTGYNLSQPDSLGRTHRTSKPEGKSYVHPNNPNFGPPSVVKVSYEPVDKYEHAMRMLDPDFDIVEKGDQEGDLNLNAEILESSQLDVPDLDDSDKAPLVRRSRREKRKVEPVVPNNQQRRPVDKRWFYQQVPACVGIAAVPAENIGIPPDRSGEALLEASSAAVVLDAERGPPPDVCPVVTVTLQDIQNAGNDEWAAWYLQGILFYEDELEWCRITGWGVECGIIIVHYSAIMAQDLTQEEHHASLSDMLAMILRSPQPPVIPDYQPSRVLRQSGAVQPPVYYRPS